MKDNTARIALASACTIAFSLNTPAFGDTGAETRSAGKLLWSVTPYIWATDTKYDLTAEGTPIDAGKTTFDDLVDTTDSSFQVVVESGMEDGHFSAFVDITYLDTSDNFSGDLLRLETAVTAWGHTLRRFVAPYDLAGFYPFRDDVSAFAAAGWAVLLLGGSLLAWRRRRRRPAARHPGGGGRPG